MTSVAHAVATTRSILGSARGRKSAYWATTALIVWELLFGGAWDILTIPYVYDMVVEDLGYPEYFLIILGVWKLLGGVALLVPGFPRLKEWAYAGAFFNYSGAVASHIAVGDGVLAWSGPAGFAVILMTSWALRPAGRRLGGGPFDHEP
jgi:uncharacterized membrane protein YphA (DoxX/SURF4 family)